MAAGAVTAGTATYPTGKFGQALAGATVTGAFATQGTDWTWEGWVRYDTVTARTAFYGWGGGSWLGVGPEGRLAGSFGGTGYQLTAGTWHHVAVGYGSGVAEVWVDGTYLYEIADDSSSVAAVTIGGTTVAGIATWPGQVDDVRVTVGRRYTFYRDLTVPTAAATVDSATAALWRFDGNLNDATGNTTSGGGAATSTPSTGTGGTTSSGTTTGTGTAASPSAGGYTASTAVIPTQGQGWFQYTETHYLSDGSGYSPLNTAELVTARTGTVQVSGVNFTARTVVFRYFYMEKYREADSIEQAYLDKVAADLAAVRAAGCTAIIRFAYLNRQESNSDPTPARVLAHIGQLAPVINQYADIVHAVQAGFIGAWGEWYYTNNFGDSGNLTAQNQADRKAVIRKLLDSLDPRIFVLLRYLGTRQAFLGTTNPDPGGADSARLGHHNDAFLADDGNWGTYNTFTSLSVAQNRAYLAAMPPVPVGGESGRYNPPMTEWANASTELATYGYGYLNPNYYGQVINVWGQGNCDTAARSFGSRLRIVSSSIPSSLQARAQATATVVLGNDGWNAPYRDRDVYLVLDDGQGHVVTSTDSIDLRSIKSGKQVTLSFSFSAPTSAGTYSAFLWLPDPSTNLTARPEYAVQLANTNVWDPATGRNRLIGKVVVSSSSGSTTEPTGGSGSSNPSSSGTLRNIVLLSVNGTVKAVKITK